MELRKKGQTHQLIQSVTRMALHFAKVVVTRTAIEASRPAPSKKGGKSSGFPDMHYKQQMSYTGSSAEEFASGDASERLSKVD